MKRSGFARHRCGAALALALASATAPARGAAVDAPLFLRDTGLFLAGSDEARPENLRYSPQYALWSDGATKRRWIQLPPGTAIDASRPNEWSFPAGTRLWKEFSVRGRKVETRMIERLPDGEWRFVAYVWNAEGTEATRAPAAGVPTEVELAPGTRYVVPGQLDCRSCHEGRTTPVLGFSALQLSSDRDPGAPHAEPGATDLRALVARGLVRGLPPQVLARPPRIAAASPTARAALGYLAANCGGCHNETGPLAGLELTLDPAGGSAAVLGSTLDRPSRYFPPGATADPVRVAPGRPDLSVLVARMRSRDPLVQMPPLGTRTVDEVGLALVERWIRETTHKKENER